MDTTIKNAPPRIFLNLGDGLPSEEFDFASLHEVTWCADKQYANDVEYVLAALPSDAARAPIIAWATDDDRVITDRQKQQAIADGGASASSVKPFSVALYAAPVAPAAAAPKTMSEVFDALANLKTDPALIEKMKACMEVFSPNEAVIGPYHVFEAGRRAIRAAKHDQIACSLVNGRGTKCTCDATDADLKRTTTSEALTDEQIYELADRNFTTRVDDAEILEFTTAIRGTPPTERMSDAARDVLAERARQINQEGWTSAHDDKYQCFELADAAAAYAMHVSGWPEQAHGVWPWRPEFWKPATPRRDLTKAGALIIAEIERIDRADRKAEIERTQCKRGVGCASLGECFAAHHGGSTKCDRDAG